MRAADEINNRAINERTKSELLQYGRVTELSPGLNPPKVRIDGKLMTIIFPEGVVVGDNVAWLDNPDNPICIGKPAESLTGTDGCGCGLYIRDVGTHDFATLESSPLYVTQEEYGISPKREPGDLIVMQFQLNDDAGDPAMSAAEWTTHADEDVDASKFLVASAFDPASYELAWTTGGTRDGDGQMVSVAGAGGVNGFAIQESDNQGVSGTSDWPTLTTTVDGCLILYGVMGTTEVDLGVMRGLSYLGSERFTTYSHLWWEQQTTAGATTQWTIDYPDGEFRVEWIMAIEPA